MIALGNGTFKKCVLRFVIYHSESRIHSLGQISLYSAVIFMYYIYFKGLDGKSSLYKLNTLNDYFLLNLIQKYITQDHIYLTCNILSDSKCPVVSINAHFKACGGKGGFGSMLRAIGAQIEKTTNRGACRDLSGRRMRDVDAEKALKEWVKNNPDAQLEKERKKQEKREKILNPGKHFLTDIDFINGRANVEEDVNDALQQGLNNETNFNLLGNKRKKALHKLPIPKMLKKDLDLSFSSSEEHSNEEVLPQTQPLALKDKGSIPLQNTVQVPDLDSTLENAPQVSSKIHQSTSPNLNGPVVQEITFERINIDEYHTIEDLEHFGLDHLKYELKLRGIKCGGTLRQRAERVFKQKITK